MSYDEHQLRPTMEPPRQRVLTPGEHGLPVSPQVQRSEQVADMVAEAVAEAVAAAMIANKSQSATPDTVRRAARAGAMKATM